MSGDGDRLDDCGCCEPRVAPTPFAHENAPGKARIDYRVGTHSSFKQAMVAALAAIPPPMDLRTDVDDDASIALADASATMLDVLTFYQERIANEAFLRTATERRSILELAREVGYELNPGVAATAALAFTLETAPGAPELVTIPEGARVQSVPGSEEKPQTFETIEAIEARPAWNALRPRLTNPPEASIKGTRDEVVWLKGTDTALKPGSAILVAGDTTPTSNWSFGQVLDARPDHEARTTKVTWRVTKTAGTPKTTQKVYALRTRASLFGHNDPDLDAMRLALRASAPGPEADPMKARRRAQGAMEMEDYVLGRSTVAEAYADRGETLAERYLDNEPVEIELDNVYERITVAGPTKASWLVLAGKGAASLFEVVSVEERSVTASKFTAKVTVLGLKGQGADAFDRRTASVHAESVELELAREPISGAVPRNDIALDQAVEAIPKGRRISVTGRIDGSAADSKTETEIAIVAHSMLSAGTLTLHLESGLKHDFDRQSLRINANVALATHGETRDQVLGSGDGGRGLQQFRLKDLPLTYVAAATPSGARSTLRVRVRGVEWEEAPRLYGESASAQAFITRATDEGLVDLTFGDGRTGARLPSGHENVTARYRVGTGLAGMVKAGQLTTLLSRPLGVKEVVNPLAAEGAADPEGKSDASRSAPLTTTTLERVVSLRDFEDFAVAFGGVGKAAATWLWAGEGRIAFITIAGPAGAQLDADSVTTRNLLVAIDAARHDDIPVRVGFYTKRRFVVTARIAVDPRYDREEVKARAREALKAGYAFEGREFGRALPASDVVARIQAVEGVVAVDLDRFHFEGDAPGDAPCSVLPAFDARWKGTDIAPAELITVNPDGITLLDYAP